MLSKDQALQLVSERLSKMSPADDVFVVKEESTIEKPFGWVFFYNSKTFFETGAPRYALAGNGPIIVNKFEKTVDFFGTNKSTAQIVEDYERAWSQNSDGRLDH